MPKSMNVLRKNKIHSLIKKNPGIKIVEIARLLGLSYSSVSNSLIGMNDISEDSNRLYIVNWRHHETP